MGNSIGKILDYVFVPRICYRPRLSSIMAGLSMMKERLLWIVLPTIINFKSILI